MPARAVSLKAASVHGTLVIVRNYLCVISGDRRDKVQLNFFFSIQRELPFKRETERRRANRRTPKSQSFFSRPKSFFAFFSIVTSSPLFKWCVCWKLMLTFRTRTHAEVDNRTLSFSRFFVFNTNKKLLGTCLRVHLCVYYALQWFYVCDTTCARSSLSLSLSLSFRIKYIKILLCVYNTRGAL